MGKWSRRVQAVGHSVLEVVQAELHSLLEDFQRTGRGMAKALVVFMVAGACLFWSVGVLIAAAVAVLAIWIELWQATLAVFLGISLVAGGLAFWGWTVVKGLEGPTTIMRRHVDDHFGWWRDHLAEDGRRLGRGDTRRRPSTEDDEELGE